MALVGPTGVGKTSLALALAEREPLEVISADSRAVYRWMDIGTAKPATTERGRVPHHLVDVVDPDESYSLATYQEQAQAAVGRVAARGRLPLLVGGAGLYVSAVLDGLSLPGVPPDEAFRAQMELRAANEGWESLQRELASVDPESAARIDPRNVRRVIRALEVQRATGRAFSAFQTAQPCETSLIIGLTLPREVLYERIDRRIDEWIARGFVDEVRTLVQRGYAPDLPSMSGIGYRELARHIAGEIALDQAVAQMKQATHQYSKRQMTWFQRDGRIRWFDARTVCVEDVLTLIPRSS